MKIDLRGFISELPNVGRNSDFDCRFVKIDTSLRSAQALRGFISEPPNKALQLTAQSLDFEHH